MPDGLTATPPPTVASRPGFHGKLPSRGDFVGARLSAAFVDAVHAWLDAGLSFARARLGDDWERCWLVAPVWRFALPPGLLGPSACAGLWLPSVDRAGRFFPLILAVEGIDDLSGSILDRMEQLGREALASDDGPDHLSARLAALPVPSAVPGPPRAAAHWSTDGGPFRPPGAFEATSLPTGATFAAMIGDPAAPSGR
ncbi:MAG: type VI secretion system-associated protein TagF [Gluconacetobacter diazotrophicus]|nr:type VI secretion system-associated protein TagF [Gluconacetobacter diazotrophicus]